ncbi:MAG TPA: zinc ribbon domain-containing protein [Mucilaginibacter sp.]|nr:zinc ribbon domain-containing protein [Mucilaginibacter sp.]
MDTQAVAANTPGACPWCNEHVSSRDEKCPKCGYPLKGDEDDIRHFKAERENYLMAVAPAERKMRRANNTLYLLAAVYFFVGAAGFFARGNFPGTWMQKMAILLGCAVIQLFAALFAKKKPAICFITGLAVVIISSAFIYLNNDKPVPLVLLAFVLVFIYFLVSGINAASTIKKLTASAVKD